MPITALIRQPGKQAGSEYPYKNGGCTDKLAGEAGVIVGDRHQKQTQQSNHPVDRDRTHRVIDLQLVQCDDAEYDQHAGNQTKQ